MKLIPARCPSCGADIEVNKSNETTKCKYCETRIFIDDAIAKYKVEIENLPTANNHLKLGTRSLNSRDFKKAHEQLEKALEIDPDNSEIIVKETLAQVLQKEITESNLTKILSAFKDAKEFCSKDTLDDLIMYSIELLEPNRNTIASVISSSPRKEILTAMLFKYKFFINFYERLFRNYASNDKTKKELIYKLFSTIQCYLNGGTHSEYNQQGTLTRYSYKIPSEDVEQLTRKKELYEDELAKVDDEFRVNLEKRRKAEADRAAEIRRIQEEKIRKRKELKEKIFGEKPDLIVDLIICAFFALMYFIIVVTGLEQGYKFNPLVFIASILFIPFCVFRIIEVFKKIPRIALITAIVIRACVLFTIVGLVGGPVGEWISIPSSILGKTLVSNFDDTTMVIEKDNITITDESKGTLDNYKYEFDYSTNKITLRRDTVTHTYKYDPINYRLCMESINSDECNIYYYVKKDAK